ncbi:MULTISPECIES: sensor histidine kinase KdpD [Ensifer]|uniref:histidine kinase n=1 Tax=Ensifer adhaerens TaxID=106592 RepID=A0ABY8HHC3_ENSAD|nr:MULTISPECIES: sensor histidine kinase KdpD [Ensifer]ANK71266.1 histidine kinase [Ensifer adhaerens]KDP73825.1 histidine kinase [Ensifer adhaerens]KQX23959.1 histidine kinase [Ensifer sp. Root423]KQZ51532.1 histidine kinase [Ensifer sp. Root558]MBD9538725.1 sensor histidine kinase KdpD [Ensifer sp. ENS04]
MPDSERDAKGRPDPDALLALAAQDRRGKLTVFLGAAPGVGKTYAMLSRARRLKDDGVDIVVGLVETHGRSETAALIDGLEILPRRDVNHRGRMLSEFDLDAALARRPRIIVVDELAHSNPAESRHPKRYQDVEELIAAGIDVWTALNIQHLESLSDIVAQITGVPVRERVPDTVLKRADDVLLVDLSPAELIERLKEGKVYLPDSAQRAVDRFFRLGNLTALRELALRRTADRVDDQMVDYLKQNAIEGIWASGERLLVCIGSDPLSEKVVRTASRLAEGLNAPWIVVFIERADRESGDGEDVRRLDETFRLAEQLGAETRRIIGNDFVEEILKLARREHATQIVIGARRQPFPMRLFRQSLPDALAERVSGIGIHLVTDRETVPVKRRTKMKRTLPPGSGRAIGIAAGSVVVSTAVGLLLGRFVVLPNISLLYLLAVLASATYAGHIAAIAAALFSVLAYNFFFIKPTGTFTIAEPHEVFALVVFLAAAALAGSLASRVREQAKTARQRAAATQALYDFSRKLSGTAKADDVLWAAVTQMQSTLKRSSALLLPEDGDLQLKAAWPPDTELDVTDIMAARWAMDKREPAGNGTGTLPNSPFHFRPLTSPHGVVGVCGFVQADKPLEINEERALAAILDQTAIAVDRARLSRESLDQAAKLEGERFRAALLSSISHDLRTPLATITGAVTSLRQLGDRMPPESRDDLLQSIEEEGGRLTRFVANLLDMTRIEAGTVNAKRDWVDVADVVRAAVDRARKYFPEREIETSIAPDLPLMRGDSVLLGQVLFNLLDNANKYGGEEPISIYARTDSNEIVLSVTDLGKGIPPRDLEQVFEKFFRRGKADGRTPGTGLGLSIAKGFVEAMGGQIKAESPALRRRGTRISMRFPAAKAEISEKDRA